MTRARGKHVLGGSFAPKPAQCRHSAIPIMPPRMVSLSAGSAEAYDGVALLTGAGGSMALLTDDDQSDELLRETIATALRVVADRVCREHVASITQEHQITSRIGEALTQRMRAMTFGEYHVQVATQDFPDHGPGALERAVGGDIYVGIRAARRGQIVLSKGFLAQAKRGPDLTERANSILLRNARECVAAPMLPLCGFTHLKA